MWNVCKREQDQVVYVVVSTCEGSSDGVYAGVSGQALESE